MNLEYSATLVPWQAFFLDPTQVHSNVNLQRYTDVYIGQKLGD